MMKLWCVTRFGSRFPDAFLLRTLTRPWMRLREASSEGLGSSDRLDEEVNLFSWSGVRRSDGSGFSPSDCD